MKGFVKPQAFHVCGRVPPASSAHPRVAGRLGANRNNPRALPVPGAQLGLEGARSSRAQPEEAEAEEGVAAAPSGAKSGPSEVRTAQAQAGGRPACPPRGPGATSIPSVREAGRWGAPRSPAWDCGSSLRAFAQACPTGEPAGPSSGTRPDRPSAPGPSAPAALPAHVSPLPAHRRSSPSDGTAGAPKPPPPRFSTKPWARPVPDR